MDEDGDVDLVRAVRAWLRPHLAASPEARRLVELIGRWLVDEARRAAPAAAAIPTEAASTRRPDPGPPPPQADNAAGGGVTGSAPASTPAPRQSTGSGVWKPSSWTIGSLARPAAPPPPAVSRPPIDLGTIEARCRLKAEACRTYIRRRTAQGDPVAEPPLVEAVNRLIARARELTGCFLWMVYPHREQPPDAELEAIARCFDALAECVVLVMAVDEQGSPGTPAELQESLQLMAEASSGLRVALQRTWLTQPDSDEEESHVWIRQEAERRQVFVIRYMRLEDPADPARAPAIEEAAKRARARLQARRERSSRIDQALKQMHYHTRRLDRGTGDAHDVRRLWEGIAQLVDLGVPGTDSRVAPSLPADLETLIEDQAPPQVQSWLAAAAQRTDGRPPDAPGESTVKQWSDTVRDVSRWLRGRRVVIVGGEPRADASRRIEQAFSLAAVEWVRLTEHGSSDPMRPAIARPDTALVLVLVKLAGHQHADDAAVLSKTAGVPCVFLPAGYNPEQIASAVVAQASWVLSARDAAT